MRKIILFVVLCCILLVVAKEEKPLPPSPYTSPKPGRPPFEYDYFERPDISPPRNPPPEEDKGRGDKPVAPQPDKPVRNPRCPPTPICSPVPKDCKKIVETTFPFDGIECPGCPICRDEPKKETPPPKEPPGCPVVVCKSQPKGRICTVVKHEDVLVNGKKCGSCPVYECKPVCPAPLCPPKDASKCSSYEPVFTWIEGVRCRDCDKCVPKNETTCPPEPKNCPPLPKDCLETETGDLNVNGLKCPGCKTCKKTPCPVLKCEPVPKDCVNKKKKTVTINGQQCPDCEECADECPPVTCPPIPAGTKCKRVEQTVVVVKGKKCGACPLCIVEKCPPVQNCTAVPSSCKKVVESSYTFNAIECKGCKTCADEPECKTPQTCPPVTNCFKVEQTVVTVGNKSCPGCPKCIPEPPCPPTPKCAPLPPNCEATKQNFNVIDGRKCPACPECTKISCPKKDCPPIDPKCAKLKESKYVVTYGRQSIECNDCPTCVPTCPVPKCAPLPKDCLKSENRFITYKGLLCATCPECKEYPKNLTCPDVKCPALVPSDCAATVVNTLSITINGKTLNCPCKVCVPPPKCPEVKCPPLDKSKCQEVRETKVTVGDKSCPGCPLCIPPPKCTPQCPCPPIRKEVEIEKIIYQKRYIPYDVIIYGGKNVTKFQLQEELYQTAKRFQYVTILKYRITQYRALLIHFRLVLRKLVIRRIIPIDKYLLLCTVLKTYSSRLETEIHTGSIRVETIQEQIRRIRASLEQLGFKGSYSPVNVCKFIGSKRVCGLHPNVFYFNWNSNTQGKDAPLAQYKKTYLKESSWFSKTVYTYEPSVVASITKKTVKTGVVEFTRTHKQWTKKVIHLNKYVKNVVWARAVAYLFKKSVRAQRIIRRYFGASKSASYKELVAAFSSYLISIHHSALSAKLKKALRKRFRARIAKRIRKLLKSKLVAKLSKTYHTYTVVKSYPTRVTQEMMRLPRSLVALPRSKLVAILSTRFSTEY